MSCSLLYVANRYERKSDLQRWLDGGLILVCDRYIASSIAYGEAQGLDPGWLADIQKFLPPPSLTIMLDIAPETAVQRKAVDRDRYERDLAMQARVRESYQRQAAAGDGSCSTASVPRTTSRRTSSPRCSHDSGRRKRANLAHARLLQGPRARFERRPRRAHIVNQDDDRAGHSACGSCRGERVAHVPVPLRGGQAGLRRRRADAAQAHRRTGRPRCRARSAA